MRARRQARGADPKRCVLVVDSERSILEMLTRALGSMEFEVASASGGREALRIAPRLRLDLVLLHLRLYDIPGLDVVRSLRRHGIEAPFIAIVGRATDPIAEEADALGAHKVIEEPIHVHDLLAAVDRAARSSSETAEPRTPAERWCTFVMRLASSSHDLKTTAAWAKCAGVSKSVIRESCRQVHVQPHDARDFARMLGAIRRSGRDWTPESVLDVGDGRTLNKLEARSGFSGRHDRRTPGIEEFLDRQELIPRDNPALQVLRTRLFDGGAPFTPPRSALLPAPTRAIALQAESARARP